MHCVTLTCSSRHYENMEESVRTRIAQTAPNAIQEIDRKAQIVRTNEPSFSSARAERSSNSRSNETPSSSTSAGGSTSSDRSTGQSRPVLPSLSRVCDARDRNAMTELRRRLPTLSSSNGAVARGGLVRRHGNVGQPSRGSVIKDIIIVDESRYPEAGKCFQKTRYPAVRNFDQFSRSSSFNSSKNIRYLFRNLKRF